MTPPVFVDTEPPPTSATRTLTVGLEVTYRCRTGLARAWVRLMSFIAPVVGQRRAMVWAVAGASRLVRVRVLCARPKRERSA